MTEHLDITIIHGAGGNPSGNWFPWLAAELKARKHQIHVPEFPRPEEQNLNSWMSCFKSHVPSVGSSSILIGHSSGAALTLNILNQLSSPIAATFLVSGFVGEIGSKIYDPLNASFFDTNFDWARIRNNAGELFIYAGDNDPYVPLPKSIEVAALLKSELILIPGGGHLNAESNFLRFDKLLSDFDRWRCEVLADAM